MEKNKITWRLSNSKSIRQSKSTRILHLLCYPICLIRVFSFKKAAISKLLSQRTISWRQVLIKINISSWQLLLNSCCKHNKKEVKGSKYRDWRNAMEEVILARLNLRQLYHHLVNPIIGLNLTNITFFFFSFHPLKAMSKTCVD